METGSGKRTLWIIIGAIILALILWWILASDKAEAPASDTLADAETADISAELSGLNEADLDAELQDIDKDLEQL